MTPEEAVVKLRENGVVFGSSVGVRRVLEQVATTAKADETRRCAAMLQEEIDEIEDLDSDAYLWFEQCRKNLLITGGLEAEGTDGKMNGDDPSGSSL